ncbi:hypothetical protein [Nonomuraea insulae]|uniref:Uncharacterized protein n=1 Tax=Nonomuraea insulae TaxID=1616787 RepID=A0ABW1CYS9_9ACTN
MAIPPAEKLHVIVLCPQLAPVAHASGCSFRHLFLAPGPDRPGDWSGTVPDLGEIRARFPGVLFHKCLHDALRDELPQASTWAQGTNGPPAPPTAPDPEPKRRPRGGHPYDGP